MKIRKMSKEQKEICDDLSPICFVCGKPIKKAYRMVKIKDDYGRLKIEKILIPPINVGDGMYRHNKKACSPGSSLYMKKFSNSMNSDLKNALTKGRNIKQKKWEKFDDEDEDIDFLYICGAMQENVMILENIEDVDKLNKKFAAHVIVDNITPEIIALKKDLFDNLSKDARYIAKYIADSPGDILSPISGKISKVLLMKKINKLFGKIRVKKICSELKNYVGELVKLCSQQ